MSTTIIYLDKVPDSANEGDKWVDLSDGRKLYVATTSYGPVASTLTVPAADRPGSVDLLFAALVAGGAGDLIDVVINDAGPSGASTLTKTGLGTASSHYLYTFNMFEDESSNDAIIALLGGDPDLTASGADATDGAFNPLTLATLSGSISAWRAMNININYIAQLPVIVDPTKQLDRSIPLDIRNSLAERLASFMLNMDEGGDKTMAQIFRFDATKAEARATHHRTRGTDPSDVMPG